jgi:hypothetical protein
MLPRLFFYNIDGEHDGIYLPLYHFDLPCDRSECCLDEWIDHSLGV